MHALDRHIECSLLEPHKLWHWSACFLRIGLTFANHTIIGKHMKAQELGPEQVLQILLSKGLLRWGLSGF